MFYELVTGTELEISLTKVILDILSLEVIFFGTNSRIVFQFLILRAKKIFGFTSNSNLIIGMLSLIGFLIHNAFIFESIINEELVSTGYFEKRDFLKLPNPIICFHSPGLYLNKDNHTYFNGKYIDSIYFKKLYTDVLSEIWYFNKTHKKRFNKVCTMYVII